YLHLVSSKIPFLMLIFLGEDARVVVRERRSYSPRGETSQGASGCAGAATRAQRTKSSKRSSSPGVNPPEPQVRRLVRIFPNPT
ncbi:MAG: hypothetical protein ACPHRO_15380, partial [Nannocystaceae bacterium]